MILRKLPFLALLSVPAFLATASTAQAYLDPGTGSMILQIVLGGVAGMMVVGKLYWAQFTSFFSRRSDSEGEAKDTSTEDR
jgi:hypothetical protein